MKSFLENLKNMDEYGKKKLVLIGSGVVAFFIILIVALFIISILNRKISYADMELIMEKAAYEYFQEHVGQLPTEEMKTAVVDVQILVEQEYMKKIKKYTKNESCTGNVVVTNIKGEYDYQAYLTCDDFNTELLVDKIKEDNKIISEGPGLYDEDGTLRFRGEQVNNYLKIKDQLYRIIKIDSENKIYIIPEELNYNDDVLYAYWDDRYNTEEDSACGINDFSVSRVNDSLNEIYNSLDKTVKENMTTYNLCIGKREDVAIANDGTIECSLKIENTKIGLLPLYEYIKSSLAAPCTSAKSRECGNYNYLVHDDWPWWTATADSTNTYSIYYVSRTGQIEKDKGYNKKMIRYVIALKNTTLLNKGNGTSSKPYQIR